ncbi:MAG: DUF998 domain-containing protein [Candidatus Thorarchaeota archaeon]|jgi:hypothetical membrane protein
MNEEGGHRSGNDWRRRSFLMAMFGTLQSFVLIPIAALFYAGGTESNASSPGFSLIENFLSDLGMITAYSGQPNLISSFFFNATLFLLGVFLILYFLAMPDFFKGHKESKWLSIAGSATGIFMAATFIGGSLTPADIYRPIHLMFGAMAFVSALPVVIFYTLAILLNENYPNWNAIGFAVLGAVILVYLVLLLNGGASGEITIFFTLGQKIVVFSILLCFLIEAYGAMLVKKEG